MTSHEARTFEDRYWTSSDGLKLHYRDYPGRADRPPVICMAGLTRNARDYDVLASTLAGDWRVLAIDFRGRGMSENAKDSATYNPLTYADDVTALIDAQKIDRYVAIGTSLGGIVTMLLAAKGVGQLAGAVLNDVGPEIDPAGLGRIRTYVGKQQVWPTWMHAARAVADANADVYPNWQIEDWLAMAKRLYRLNSSGRIVLAYDMKIADPFRVPGGEVGPDMWAALAAMRQVPTLIVRGALSDVLAEKTAKRMVGMLDRAELLTIPATGHTPTLSEAAAVKAIRKLLTTVAKEPAAV